MTSDGAESRRRLAPTSVRKYIAGLARRTYADFDAPEIDSLPLEERERIDRLLEHLAVRISDSSGEWSGLLADFDPGAGGLASLLREWLDDDLGRVAEESLHDGTRPGTGAAELGEIIFDRLVERAARLSDGGLDHLAPRWWPLLERFVVALSTEWQIEFELEGDCGVVLIQREAFDFEEMDRFNVHASFPNLPVEYLSELERFARSLTQLFGLQFQAEFWNGEHLAVFALDVESTVGLAALAVVMEMVGVPVDPSVVSGLPTAEDVLAYREALEQRAKERAELTPRPEPRLLRSAFDAEAAACEWMRAFGFSDAVVTASGPDGGIDVQSSEAVAQVKMEAVKTSRPALQNLFGVAAADSKRAVFFSLAGYTREALSWASRESVQMALFQFNFQGEAEPVSEAALALWSKIAH